MSNYKEQYLHNPSYILNDGRLDPTKKILLSYILSLSKTSKGCYASNKTFGELLNINPDGASKQISKLKRLGYIETKRLYKNSKEYRYIKVLNQTNNKNNNHSDIFINIPYLVLFDINLSSTQKLLMSEILTLLKLPEGCYKSNNDFGKLIDKLNIDTGGCQKERKPKILTAETRDYTYSIVSGGSVLICDKKSKFNPKTIFLPIFGIPSFFNLDK